MREFNAFRCLPSGPVVRSVAERDIRAKIAAADRGAEFFDGARSNGYGGLVNDGRWHRVCEDIIAEYRLFRGDSVCQLQCEKGFLLREFEKRGIITAGTETSRYCLGHLDFGAPRLLAPWDTGYRDKQFELVIAAGAVYTYNLAGAIRVIKEVQRIGRHAFITLGSFDEDDEALMRKWSLLGTTILSRDDWLQVLKHCGYTGDYWFVTPRTLGLVV